ncbi:MAG: flagellar biosynthesis anti-sigma factor FlgM [Sedimentisphaerales bacterium]|nr:flagellar biosynthesis anti-sigma factor FlgM [Sedimentisphaerales bacterium]
MPKYEINSRFKHQNDQDMSVEDLSIQNEDAMMETILENLNTTPIGQVLKKIASLPEIRQDKVLNVRRQLTDGDYDLNERLNIAMDKVLEDLTS